MYYTTTAMVSATDKLTPKRSEAKLHKRQRQRRVQQQVGKRRRRFELSPAKETALKRVVARIQHGSQILETIDQLRRRKARPSTDRICGYMLRNFEVDAAYTLSSLNQLLKCEAVVEVEYKGGASFRNALKWSKLDSYKSKPEFVAKTKFNHMALEKAFYGLYLGEPDYVDQGVPPNRLIETLLESKNPNSALRNSAEKYLNDEVANGYLVQRSNRHYSLANPPQENGESELKGENCISGSSSSDSSNNSSPNKICELDDSIMDHDSRSNSQKSSGQTSPKIDLDKMKNEDIYGIIVGRDSETENGDRKKQTYNDIVTDETCVKNDIKLNENKDETMNTTAQQSCYKKSKAERKQRLYVRSDDSMDLVFNDDPKEIHYKDENDENYRISDKGESDPEAGRSSENVSPTPSQTNSGGFRSARRKRAKKVFDPSDNMVVKRKRGRYSNAVKAAMANAQQDTQETTKCVVSKDKNCYRQCNECSKDKNEALMACRDCTVRVHPSCVYTQEEVVLKALTNWQCDDCKSCNICFETRKDGPMVTCFKCNDSYHFACHNPKVISSKNKWFCCKCNLKPEKPIKHLHPAKEKLEQHLNNISNISLEINKAEETLIKNETTDEDEKIAPAIFDTEIDTSIPDISDWNEEQVYKYFARLFPTDADIFRQEKIDGTALQLLTRADVIDRFDSIKFGPRLKMWTQIVILQKRRHNRWDYWK